MPATRFQKLAFAFITVVITVHLFVFYNLVYVNGWDAAYLAANGVNMFGRSGPVWAVVVVEFVCAFVLEVLVGSPCSVRLALKVIDPACNKPYMVETGIICATVGLMCPMMSFLATIIYGWGYFPSVWAFLSAFLKTVMHNFPLAFFGQLFFIQPLVRTIFKLLFRKQLAAR